MPATKQMSFPVTRQGVRNLDEVDARSILPVSGPGPRSGTPVRPTTASGKNVNEVERWLSTLAGSALVTYGLVSRSPQSLLGAALGGLLVYRGMSGHCALYSALGHSTAPPTDPTLERVYTRS